MSDYTFTRLATICCAIVMGLRFDIEIGAATFLALATLTHSVKP
jgi:hypothetical protein